MDVKQYYTLVQGNYDGAKSIMMNDQFIERMLGKFFDGNSYEEIIASYENKDFKSLFAQIHSFKGVVGNLSLTPLYDIASIITEATRGGEYVNIDNEINTLKEKYLHAKKCFKG